MSEEHRECIEEPVQRTCSENNTISDVQITGEGQLEIYLSSGEKKMTEYTPEQCHKILEKPSGRFPLGLLETFSSDQIYAFTYVHRSKDEPSSVSIEDAQQLTFPSLQADTALNLFHECLEVICSLYDALFELGEYNQNIRRFVHSRSRLD